MSKPQVEPRETSNDSGVDRTLIRQRLALTPAERARLAVESARNVVRIKTNLRHL
ncbi:MAG TPA: hypothetical protein VGQ76_06580 [Thermoanaerobaculia bacterium]|jgi:hypothetical protein|nr:hypothetical protein [Thermoanaerobaculia bacterium]